MTQIDQSISPFYNDYDENKRFHQILFRSARAVQLRELTQLQSILQKQIERVGSHIFNEGSVVVPGELNYDLDTAYAKITLASGTYDDFAPLILASDSYVVGMTNNIEAQVATILPPENGDPITVYVKYKTSGTDNVTKEFQVNETLDFKAGDGSTIVSANVDEVGTGSTATIGQGIYYAHGQFLIVLEQTIVIGKYTKTPSVRVGLDVVEEVVTYQEDTSLLDNANGTRNHTAPGADRLRMTLTLTTREIGSEDDEDFIELLRLNEGALEKFVRGPDYSVLNDTLAQRTKEQAGDYVVDNFEIDIIEDFDDGDNGGLSVTGDEAKIVAQLDPGTAYVNGYRVETVGTTNVHIDKARDTALFNNSVTSVLLGNYVRLEDVQAVPQFDSLQTVDLFSQGNGTGILQGTCRVRQFQFESTGIYRCYIFDVRNTSGDPDSTILSNTISMKQGSDVIGNCVGHSSGQFLTPSDSGNNTLVYPLPQATVKTLKDQIGNNDTTYTYTKHFSGVVSGGEITITSPKATDYFVPASPSDYVISVDGVLQTSAVFTVQAGNTSVVISGVADGAASIAATVKRNETVEKVKTKTSTTFVGTPDATGLLKLNKCDIVSITSVIEDLGGGKTNDVTKNFDFDHGRRENFYDLGTVYTLGGAPIPANPVTVTYEYFQHGVGDYFTVDSYAGIEYIDIPEEVVNGEYISLADVVDFRPRLDDTGANFTGTNANLGLLPKPSTFFECNFDYYLDRIDFLYLTNKGEFGIIKGVPSTDPKDPELPQDVMHLYTLDIPAYTKSVSEIDIDPVDNKRYTMRDIGMLEKRVDSLEYYTTLSLLEKETSDMQILDASTGLNRFKNGFLVDPFENHDVGDEYNEDYNCSIDEVENVLRPEFGVEGIDLILDEGISTDYQLTDDTITLPYTEVSLFQQPYATRTMNVNPYAVFSWTGSIKLFPSRDSWIDTRYTAPVVRENTVVLRSTRALLSTRKLNRRSNRLIIRGRPSVRIRRRYNFWLKGWKGIGNTYRARKARRRALRKRIGYGRRR